MQLTEDQKKQLVGIGVGVLIALVVQALAVMGIDVVQPRLIPPATATPAPAGIVSTMTAGINGYECGAGTNFCLRSLYGRDLEVYSDSGSTSKFSVDGATGNVTAAGYASVGSVLKLVKQTTLEVTQGGTITPTGSMQPITSTAGITASTVATGTTFNNWLVRLVNTNASDTIVLTNSGTLVLPGAGDLTLGANDGVWIWYDGSKWVAQASVNN